jgi:hypothetical protein
MRWLLQERYQFPAEGIVALTEAERTRALRPTRANIQREFQRLADQARAGDQVVVFLAGHGSQQPESDPPDPIAPELDGLDEIFLPADVDRWHAEMKRVPNAIIDDEIGAWLGAITAKKAYVWAIFDCCHSGTMTRGSERVREVPPDTLVPPDEIENARARAAKRNGGTRGGGRPEEPVSFIPRDASDYLVALYACRPEEREPEDLQPVESPNGRTQGLLTYSLVNVLARSAEANATAKASLTYRDLLRGLEARYAGRMEGAPTPFVEGAGEDRVVLGTELRPPAPFVLTRERGEYKVNAGGLYGLTPGSILAVETPVAADGKRTLLGHVSVRSTTPFAATVEPCAYEGSALVDKLPPFSTCRLVYLDFGLRRFKVAIQLAPEQDPVAQKLRAALKPLTEPDRGLIELVKDDSSAELLMRLDRGKLILLEASDNRAPLILSSPENADLPGELREKLERIFRARNLIGLASRFEEERQSGKSAIDVDVEVLRHKAQDPKDLGEVFPVPHGGWVFRPGNFISFRVTNKSPKTRVNVTLLVVGSDFGIAPFYPSRRDNPVNEGVGRGEKLSTPSPWGAVDDCPPFGPECLIVIAAPETKPPVDFAVFAQPGLRQARGIDASRSVQTPLEELLESAMLRTGSRSGMSPSQVTRYGMRILRWRTEPK